MAQTLLGTETDAVGGANTATGNQPLWGSPEQMISSPTAQSTSTTSTSPDAAIQEAVQKAIQQMGASGSYAQYGQDLQSDLAATGAFSPQQLQTLDASNYISQQATNPGSYSNKGGGNTSAFETAADNALDKAIAGTPSTSSSAAGNTATALQNSPTGLPTAAGLSGTAPAPVSDFGATPSVTPTYVSPTQNSQYMGQYESAVNTALQPTFQQEDSQLQDSLAARGISNSGAAGYLQGNLEGQQAAAVASADEPIISQGYGYTQQDITGNANVANADTLQNANYYASALGANYSAYNNYLNTLEGQGYNTGNEAYEAYLNSFLPNSGVENTFLTAEGGANTAYGNIFNTQQEQANQNFFGSGSSAGSSTEDAGG